MLSIDYRPHPSWRYAAGNGALLGAALTFGYALAFVFYAAVRSALTILAAGAVDAGTPATIAATAAAILWTSLVAACLLGIIAAFIGALTALVLKVLLAHFNVEYSTARAFVLGIATAAGFAAILYAALIFGVGFRVTAESLEAFLFWLGLPTLLYIAAGGVGAVQFTQKFEPPQAAFGKIKFDRLSTGLHRYE